MLTNVQPHLPVLQAECSLVIDKYVEQDGALICLDLTLLRTAAFRHFVFNRVPFATGITPWFFVATLLLLLTSVYMKMYTQSVYEYSGGPLPAPALGSVVMSFDGQLPSQYYFDESFELRAKPLPSPDALPVGVSLVYLLAQRAPIAVESTDVLASDTGHNVDNASKRVSDGHSLHILNYSSAVGQFEPMDAWKHPHPADWLWHAAGLGCHSETHDIPEELADGKYHMVEAQTNSSQRGAPGEAISWGRVPAYFLAALLENTVFALTCVLAARGLQLSRGAPANTLLVACAGVLPLQSLLLENRDRDRDTGIETMGVNSVQDTSTTQTLIQDIQHSCQDYGSSEPVESGATGIRPTLHHDHSYDHAHDHDHTTCVKSSDTSQSQDPTSTSRVRVSSGTGHGLMSVVASRVWAGTSAIGYETSDQHAGRQGVAQTGEYLARRLLSQWMGTRGQGRGQGRVDPVVVRTAGRGDSIVHQMDPDVLEGSGNTEDSSHPVITDGLMVAEGGYERGGDDHRVGAARNRSIASTNRDTKVPLWNSTVLPAVDVALLVGLLASSTPRLLSLLSIVWAYPAGFFLLVSALTRAGNVVAVRAVLRCGWDGAGAVVAGGMAVEVAVRVWLYTAGVVFDILLVYSSVCPLDGFIVEFKE